MLEHSYIYELLAALTKEERRQFGIYLNSDFCNPGKQASATITLYRILEKSLDNDSVLPLEKERVYRQVYPGDSWVEGRLEKLMVELNKLLRSFLLHQHYFRENNEFRQQIDFGGILQAKGLNQRYQQLLNRLYSAQRQQPWKNADYFFNQYQLEYAIFEQESYVNKKKGDLNIPRVLQNLNIFYHLNRLYLLNYFLLQQRMTNLEISEGIEFALNENQLPKRYLQESGVLHITYKIFQLLQQPEPTLADFQELADLLHAEEPRLEKSALREFYAYLRNLCVLVNRQGKTDLNAILFQIQQHNLERGYLYIGENNDKLSSSAVLNLVTTALIVGQTDWVNDFLNRHQYRIHGDNETLDFYRLNKACYLFAMEQFEDALEMIPPAFSYVDYQLVARRLEIKIYYELNSDLLPYKLDAFKMYISRASHKFLAPDIRRQNADFINLLLQISNSSPGDKNRSERLVKRVLQKKMCAEWRWLLEKARQLG